MKKAFFLLAALSLTLSACAPALFQSPAASPAPFFEADLQGTVAAQVAQTIQSMPTPSLAPSATPFVITATSAPTQTPLPPTPTSSATPVPPTPSAVTGTVAALPTQGGGTPLPSETPHYQYYGTMPPDLPYGRVAILNLSKRDAYISLQCTTSDGYVTVIEYPVGGSRIGARVPAGYYLYVAWVGGKQMTGNFKLQKSEEAVIKLYQDRVEVK